MAKIHTKVRKIGNSYGILLEKALVDHGFFKLGETVELSNDHKKHAENGILTPDILCFDPQNYHLAAII
jgi:hypothetical protein